MPIKDKLVQHIHKRIDSLGLLKNSLDMVFKYN